MALELVDQTADKTHRSSVSDDERNCNGQSRHELRHCDAASRKSFIFDTDGPTA
jgi:hypothetical protein